MNVIRIKDKNFRLSIPEEEIIKQVKRVANEINKDLEGENPVFISVLNGAFMFTSDLMKYITLPSEISFIKLSSYSGTESTGNVKQVMGLSTNIKNRTVVVVEDIVDTGLTMKKLLDILATCEPKQIKICSLLVKPEKMKVNLDIDYVAMSIPNDFIVGYGLDYNEMGRNLPAIYTVEE